MSRHSFNPPTTKAKQRVFLLAITANLERDLKRDAPHLLKYVTGYRYLESQMHNRVPAKRGRAESLPMSPAVKQQIRFLHAVDPGMPQHAIGTRVGVNQGRVNNTLIGVRQ